MPLSLHVFPPAFSLPSIDAECLAAIAYLSRALPRNAWTLIAESGLTEGLDLPCLRDGATAIVGFDAIVDHLRKISNGQWDLDAQLDKQQKADCFAYVFSTSVPATFLLAFRFMQFILPLYAEYTVIAHAFLCGVRFRYLSTWREILDHYNFRRLTI